MANCTSVLNVANDSELLSYIINADPVLSAELPLPKQGEGIKEYGKLISSNQRWRNAFINVVNLIGLTVIKRNAWNDPWDFTERGTIRWGQSVREIILDLVRAHDYNEFTDMPQYMLGNYVPNALEFIHDINFQKFYCTTTSDEQLAMAFDSEGGLFDFIDSAIRMNYESLIYDRYQINKYMLARRILDGTVTPTYIDNFNSLTPRERVSAMKSASNKMAFRSPNYNPAGIRKATSFDDQILIVSTEFEASFTTEVMATSFFKDEADFRARLRLVDGFDNLDVTRLAETLGDDFIPLESEEEDKLASIPAILISKEWFMNYSYAFNSDSGMRETEFYNPMTLRNNHFLHYWGVFSTSPFENATVFTTDEPEIVHMEVVPEQVNLLINDYVQKVKFNCYVETNGFINKAVIWDIDATAKSRGCSINEYGEVTIPAEVVTPITVTARSVYDNLATATGLIGMND